MSGMPFVFDKLPDHVTGVFNFRESSSAFHIYACAQPNVEELHQIFAERLPPAKGQRVWYVNLRDETTLFVNGFPISLFADGQPMHVGMPREQIIAEERALAGKLRVAGQVNVHSLQKDESGEFISDTYQTIKVHSVQTEIDVIEQIAAKSGYNVVCVRLCIVDHETPQAPEIDMFLNLAGKFLRSDDIVIGHCHAGKGRSATFVEMLKQWCNVKFGIPVNESANDLVSLGKLTRSTSGATSVKQELRIDFIVRYKRYLEDGLARTSWSNWLQEQDEESVSAAKHDLV